MTSNAPVRLRRTLVATLAAVGALAAGTACSSSPGGTGVASLGPSHSASGASSAPTSGSALGYSECMRSHGVPKFPDPGPNGDLQLRAGPGTGIDPNSSTFKAAQQACQSLLPTHSAADAHKNYEALLKFSQCMRSHGIKDFPDPSADGGLRIQSTPGSDLDTNSALFQSAQRACQKYMPGKGGPGGTTNQVTG